MRETIVEPPDRFTRTVSVQCSARGEAKFIRQQGEPGRYGHVILTVEPAEEACLRVEWVVPPSKISGDYMEAVARGIRDACSPEGKLAGCRFVHTRVRVIDGTEHPQDSAPTSFRIAGQRAFVSAVTDSSLRGEASDLKQA